MEDRKGGRPAPFTLQEKMLVAGVSACFAEICTLPLDTIKVRLQTQRAASLNRGISDCTKRILKEGGVAGLWKGLSPGLTRQMMFASLRIGLYQPVRDILSREDSPATVADKIEAGMLTGGIGILIANPVDLVKIRLQTDSSNQHCRLYHGMVDAFRQIFRSSGISGFYQGVLPNIVRSSVVNAAELATMDHMKAIALNSQRFDDGIQLQCLCAAGAAAISTTIGSPMDVVRTRMMNAGSRNGIPEYEGVIHCIKKAVRSDGVRCFYRGALAMFLRISCWNAITFSTLEAISASWEPRQ